MLCDNAETKHRARAWIFSSPHRKMWCDTRRIPSPYAAGLRVELASDTDPRQCLQAAEIAS